VITSEDTDCGIHTASNVQVSTGGDHIQSTFIPHYISPFSMPMSIPDQGLPTNATNAHNHHSL